MLTRGIISRRWDSWGTYINNVSGMQSHPHSHSHSHLREESPSSGLQSQLQPAPASQGQQRMQLDSLQPASSLAGEPLRFEGEYGGEDDENNHELDHLQQLDQFDRAYY